MLEKELNQKFVKYFGKYFNVKTEVCPDDSRKKIDVLLEINGFEWCT